MITGIILLIICLASYYYLFNIYETTININPLNLFADNHSTASITIIPVNALGWKVPFRNIPADFEIKEGRQLVDIIYEDKKRGKLILQAKNITGTVVIYVKSKYSLLPSLVEIHIFPNYAINN